MTTQDAYASPEASASDIPVSHTPEPAIPVAIDEPKSDTKTASYKVLGFDLAALPADVACGRILEFVREGRSREVHLCNSYTLVLACRDDELASALS